jgi:glucose-1-phosphate thymidylyltransferase
MNERGGTDKAVILARGLGTRMRKDDAGAALDPAQAAVAGTGVKALIPLGDRPFLDYVLSALADAGYRRVCLVIGPEHDAVRDYYGRTVAPRRLEIAFAVQDKPLGTANAVAAAEAFAGGDRFLMINSDNFYPPEACRGLRDLDGPGIAAFERAAMLAGSNIAPDRIAKFAAAQVSADEYLERVIEKPDAATLASLGDAVYLSMNCWMLTPRIFEACRAIAPSVRGEYEVTDAVQHTIDRLGERYRVLPVRAPVLDLSSRGDVAPVAAKLAGTTVDL